MSHALPNQQSAAPLTLAQAFAQAVGHHQDGRLPEAIRLYHAILQAQPDHPDANHNLGVIAVQLGTPALGLPHLQTACAADPSGAQYWLSYIDALLAAGQAEEAQQALEQGGRQALDSQACAELAARIAAQNPAAQLQNLFAQAIDHYQEGRLAAAEDLCQQVLLADPGHVDSLNLVGIVAWQDGRLDHAEQMLGQAIALNGQVAEFHANLAGVFQAQGRLDAALGSYATALDIRPDYAEALSNLGTVLQAQGRLDEAAERYQAALAIAPAYAEAHSNLGTILQAQGQLDAAGARYEQALAIKPDYVDALCNLGTVLLAQGRYAEAVQRCEAALALSPDHATGLANLGCALQAQDRLDEAIARYEAALALRPDDAETLANLAGALKLQGRQNEAVARYQQALALNPDHASAAHLLAALTGGGGADAAPHAYVAQLFDQCADKFDHCLIEELEYRTPELLAGLIREALPAADAALTVGDLGCGTGLSGLALAPLAGTLVGVDLSPRMLEKAAERGVYRRLVQSDLLSMMRGEATAGYDLLVAADVFVYIGRLDEIIAEGSRLLRPGGLFAFSVEDLDCLVAAPSHASHAGQPFVLNPSGRYAHASAYLRALADAHGYALCRAEPCRLRTDAGQPIYGVCTLFRKLG